ncbi:hypothetical protein [Fodinibius sediminis]|uniref:Immunity protein 17 n=1 Tax=Fodinibius sediminis TaxID=1214077 RepID=A0A521E4Q9_9BACT|nr:hypothetical protein [Fodinibius sediminis]SMO78944.1 hypothetical protein SAMN06265218_11365 [Fodinibius sediminis]
MILILIAFAVGVVMLVWFWKVPVQGLVRALERGGSSTFEAYMVVVLLGGGLAAFVFVIYSIM